MWDADEPIHPCIHLYKQLHTITHKYKYMLGSGEDVGVCIHVRRCRAEGGASNGLRTPACSLARCTRYTFAMLCIHTVLYTQCSAYIQTHAHQHATGRIVVQDGLPRMQTLDPLEMTPIRFVTSPFWSM